MKKCMFVVVLALVSMASAAQNFRANIDESVKPGDDFWQYATSLSCLIPTAIKSVPYVSILFKNAT
jgi:hypothetical protein